MDKRRIDADGRDGDNNAHSLGAEQDTADEGAWFVHEYMTMHVKQNSLFYDDAVRGGL